MNLTLFLILLSILLVSGCSSDSSDSPPVSEQPIEKEFEGEKIGVDKESFTGEVKVLAFGGGMREQFEPAAADFMEEYPNVKVELFEESYTEMPVLLAAGIVPDVVIMGHNPGDWIADGLLEELSSYYESDPDISKEMFYPPAYDRLLTPDGKVWGVPWQVDPNFAFMYHPHMLDQYGISEIPSINSLQQFGEFLSQFWIVEAGEQVMTTFLPYEIYGPINTLQTIAYTNGAVTSTFYDSETNTANFNDPLIVAALEWMVNFKRLYVDDQRLQQLHATLPEGLGRFQAEKSFMEPAVTPGLRDNFVANPDIAFHPMPADSLWVGGWNYSIISASENKKAAWEFIKWIGATDEGAESTLKHFGNISAKVDNPYLEELAQTDPVLTAAIDVLENVRNMHLVSYLPVFYEDEFNEKWNEVIYEGTLEPKAFLDHMTKYIQGLLDEWAAPQ